MQVQVKQVDTDAGLMEHAPRHPGALLAGQQWVSRHVALWEFKFQCVLSVCDRVMNSSLEGRFILGLLFSRYPYFLPAAPVASAQRARHCRKSLFILVEAGANALLGAEDTERTLHSARLVALDLGNGVLRKSSSSVGDSEVREPRHDCEQTLSSTRALARRAGRSRRMRCDFSRGPE